MRIPTVTLEDLQNFQATHFHGPHQPLQPPAPSAEPAAADPPSIDEDDLGYYPDGVKRTLTDEQIRIFRHSEIHALLRKRQLEQDEAEYEARSRKRSIDEVTSSVMEEQLEESSTSHVERSSVPQRSALGSARLQKRVNPDIPDQSAKPLDYEDEAEQQALTQASRSTKPPPPSFSGRRIISYDD
ncbi:hypothetical protein PDE_06507 [Penicillium oxalicum 114-2]|uniref:Uncharacterized protein n=1 Tax=Penicillium oxalicum (strain 114-2 / CGMCC 5302) TaxID=933388 RepID=S8B9S4_PENO1|nr:hypothetical protein PDE_06507 [Penicillium oxalicum 114-2]